MDEDAAAAQAAADTVESRISALDDVGAVEYLEQLELKWHVNNPPGSYEDAFAIGCEVFGVNVLHGINFDNAGSFGFTELDPRGRDGRYWIVPPAAAPRHRFS